jgi:hypothetical protein
MAATFSEAATFTPAGGGAGIACRVILSRPREIAGLGIAGVAAYNTRVTVRKAEIAVPDGGTFSGAPSFGGLTYRVASAELDVVGQVWRCALQPTT